MSSPDSPEQPSEEKTVELQVVEAPPVHIGRYKLIRKIGAGGMGEIFLGEDERLNRKVALKLLPAEFTRDADRVRRFELEAKAASALNHPNIITIYEIGEADGTHYIVTEYIEGKTLRQQIMAERLTIETVLDVAIQMSKALKAAHEVGIVHRDIKPENVMVRPDGLVKVLDFGIAKLIERPSAPQSKPNAGNHQIIAADDHYSTKVDPYVTKRSETFEETATGIIMGTVTYMSPEQLRGQKVDPRADIFSLGVVLYEVIAGTTPFAGGTQADRIAAILEREPAPLVLSRPEVPRDLERIVSGALCKDRDGRYQHIGDVLTDLNALRQALEIQATLNRSGQPDGRHPAAGTGWTEEASTSGNEAVHTDPTPAAPTTSSVNIIVSEIKLHKRKVAVGLAAFGVLMAILAYGLYTIISRRSQAATPFQPMKITRLTSTGRTVHVAISRDGKYVVHVQSDSQQQSLWLRQVTAANDLQLLPPAPVQYWGATFSQDGDELYYVVREKDGAHALYRIPVLGGSPQKLLSGVDSPVTFSPDGKRMAFVRGDYPNPNESALVIANADGSGEQAVARRQPPERFFPIWFTGPSWSPDGKLIACAMARSEGGEYAGVTVVRVEDGRERALTRRRWQLVSRVEWLADGSGLMMIAADQPSSPHQVWYLSYPNGEARSINNDLSSYRCLSLTSDSTKLVSIRQTVPMNIWLVPDGDANRARQIVSGQDVGTQSICWVPDGRVIYSLDVDGNTDLWALQPDAGNRKQLTAKAGNNFSPTVSPDGRFVVFVSTRAGANNIWRIDLDGGNPQQLSRGDDDFSPTFSPDGQWVFYSSSAPETRGLWRVPAAGGDPQRLTDVLYHRAVISPDGRQIACTYTDGPSGGERETKIAVIPIDGGGPTKTYDLQTDSIASPDIVWSADGQSLIYNVVRDNVSNLWRRPLSGGPATQVTDFKSDLIITFAWSRDGKQLVCTRGSSIRDAVLISDIR